jgi:hypothetical protein
VTTEELEARTLLLGKVLTQQAAVSVAERELNELGIDKPSLFDIMSWANANRKERERLALEWATLQSLGEPSWKARN